MRNILKITVLALFIAIAGFANAQTPKFGHINMQALIQVMPERATAMDEFNAFQAELEGILGTLNTELETLYAEYSELGENASELVKNNKAQDITDKQTRIQNFSNNAQQQLQDKYMELIQPVLDKANEAIEAVGKEQGLIYVFDVSEQTNVVLYKSNESIDLLPLVKVKLGIQ